MICTAHHTLLGDKMENDEMGGACGTYGGVQWCVEGFGGES
jgi:hypothetical protein